jgi:hypothetical protein
MKQTIPIWHDSQLYEVTFAGTMVYLIQRFSDANSVGRVVGFSNLPDEVKHKIVNKIKSINKKKALVVTKFLVVMALFCLLGTFIWFLLFKLLINLWQ